MTRSEALVQLRRIAKRVPECRALLEEIADALEPSRADSTRSALLVSRVRKAAHDERNDRREATELQALALELCEEHEIVVAQALRAERTIHEMVKGGAA
ncbi:MAG: hypothetical protein JNG85_14635 [Spirochaetaceae bacterium]|nr:hypothetical protein [Spirochaetaceae bacterium]